MLHNFACWLADKWTALNANPTMIALFIPICLVYLCYGWWIAEFMLYLLILTTALSIDASLMSRISTWRLRRQDGEVE